MDALAANFHVKAINLFGYGQTPPWTADRSQTLADQAELVEAIIPDEVSEIRLVGHSFGASVAIETAMRRTKRVDKLVLLEPNPFHLLREHGRLDAFAEAATLRDTIKYHGARNEWHVAAERFADYWGGSGTWAAMSAERRATFAEALEPNFHEWDAVMDATASLAEMKASLPASTMVIFDPRTVRPIREIVELMRAAAGWHFETISEGGHMAPLTHPHLVNPIVERFLMARA